MIHSQDAVVANFAVVRSIRFVNLARLAVSFEPVILVMRVFLSLHEDHPPDEHLHLGVGEVAGRVQRQLLDALVVVRTDVEQTVVPLLQHATAEHTAHSSDVRQRRTAAGA